GRRALRVGRTNDRRVQCDRAAGVHAAVDAAPDTLPGGVAGAGAAAGEVAGDLRAGDGGGAARLDREAAADPGAPGAGTCAEPLIAEAAVGGVADEGAGGQREAGGSGLVVSDPDRAAHRQAAVGAGVALAADGAVADERTADDGRRGAPGIVDGAAAGE